MRKAEINVKYYPSNTVSDYVLQSFVPSSRFRPNPSNRIHFLSDLFRSYFVPWHRPFFCTFSLFFVVFNIYHSLFNIFYSLATFIHNRQFILMYSLNGYFTFKDLISSRTRKRYFIKGTHNWKLKLKKTKSCSIKRVHKKWYERLKN